MPNGSWNDFFFGVIFFVRFGKGIPNEVAAQLLSYAVLACDPTCISGSVYAQFCYKTNPRLLELIYFFPLLSYIRMTPTAMGTATIIGF